jgi:hypothetical protein
MRLWEEIGDLEEDTESIKENSVGAEAERFWTGRGAGAAEHPPMSASGTMVWKTGRETRKKTESGKLLFVLESRRLDQGCWRAFFGTGVT